MAELAAEAAGEEVEMPRRRAGDGKRICRKAKRQVKQPSPVPLRGKYAGAVVFDPAVWRKQQQKKKAAEERALGAAAALHMPWACDPADDLTLARLAKLAGESVGELCYRRNAFSLSDHDRRSRCPESLQPGRRRCMFCPSWLDDGTPF